MSAIIAGVYVVSKSLRVGVSRVVGATWRVALSLSQGGRAEWVAQALTFGGEKHDESELVSICKERCICT